MLERKISTTPISLPRTSRRDKWRGLSSCRAGQIVPVAFFPLLREDQLRGRINVQVQMAEALHTIINPIRVRMQAYLVPKLAMARFNGSFETFNRSFSGELMPDGSASPPWDTVDGNLTGLAADDVGHLVFDKLGIHYKKSSRITSDILEAYWTIVNWRRRAVSQAIAETAITSNTLAPAFWDNIKMGHIKPSFDASMMEASVPVGIDGTVPVSGAQRIGQQGTVSAGPADVSGTASQMTVYRQGTSDGLRFDFGTSGAGMRVDLSQVDGSISLANIKLAEQAQRFAELRQRYSGIPDEYLIDLLMRGIHVPPEDFREPIMLGMTDTVIGQTERYATDGASLDQSVTRGIAQMSLPLNTPVVNTGGIVMVLMEIVPEQLYERIADTAIIVNPAGTSADVPNAMADYLDPQKVEVVDNAYADIFHTAPTGVFGYQPLNADWQRDFARVGGRYKRPVDNAFVEDRQRIWAVEKVDPTLSSDFYLCPSPFPHTVFADANADPFEIITIADCVVRGLTQFGAGFEEDQDHYEKVMADVDAGRITSDAPAAQIVQEPEDTEQTPEAKEGEQ